MSTRTVNQGGGPAPDYSNLNAAVDDSMATDTIEVQNTWSADDTTQVVWNVAVSVTADAAAKQIGRPFQSGDTHYRHRVTSGHSFVVTAEVDITDLDIQSDSSGVSDELFRAAGSDGGTLTNMMLGFTGNTDQQDVWYTEDNSTKTIEFEQCFFYDVGRTIVDQWSGGGSGTMTVKFNSCGGYNIGANGGRAGGSWVGVDNSNSGDTIAVFAHNCLCHGAALYIFSTNSVNPTFNVDANYCITNEISANFIVGEDSEDVVGSDFEYTWTAAADPGTGDFVGLTNITSGTYDPALTDHANNDAKGFHAVLTDAGLTIPPLDILGQTRATGAPPTNFFDCGPSALTLAAGGVGVWPSPTKQMAHLLNR